MPTEPEAPKLKQKRRAFKPFLGLFLRQGAKLLKNKDKGRRQRGGAANPAKAASTAQAAAGLRFLRQVLPASGRNGRGKRLAWRLCCLRLCLTYEKLRLGTDAQSLCLLKRAAECGAELPPLTLGQWRTLLIRACGMRKNRKSSAAKGENRQKRRQIF